jgi:hypothetical protein
VRARGNRVTFGFDGRRGRSRLVADLRGEILRDEDEEGGRVSSAVNDDEGAVAYGIHRCGSRSLITREWERGEGGGRRDDVSSRSPPLLRCILITFATVDHSRL